MGAIYGILGDARSDELHKLGERLHHRGVVEHNWSISSTIHLGLLEDPATGLQRGIGELPVVFDGFLDNLEELSQLVGGNPRYEFGDEARAVHEVYLRHGVSGFGYLSGHFAFAIWDVEAGRLVMGRDRLGARPLYLTRTNGRLIFASEYKAILTFDEVPARPNRDAIQYLQCTRFPRPDASFLADVAPVSPGFAVSTDGTTLETRRYWELGIAIPQRSEQSTLTELRRLILDSVERQAARYDRIGVSLSGGLDSALTVAALREVSPDKEIFTFSAGFGPEDRELIDAAAVAKHFGTTHHEIVLNPEDLPDILPPTIWYLEDPAGREEIAFLYVTSKAAAEHVTMLMAGYGADLLFGGMPRHLLVNLGLKLPPVRKPLREFFRYTQTGKMPESLSGRALTKLYYRGRSFPAPKVIGAGPMPDVGDLEPRGDQPLSAYLLNALTNESVEAKTERLHSAFGITFNAPCMDRAVIEYAFTIPDGLKIRGFKQKYALRKAFEGLLPDEVLHRKKTFQKLRHDSVLSDVLDQLAGEHLSDPAVRARGLFDPEYVRRVRSRTRGAAYSSEQAFRLWSVLVTEMWAKMYLDERGKPPDELPSATQGTS